MTADKGRRFLVSTAVMALGLFLVVATVFVLQGLGAPPPAASGRTNVSTLERDATAPAQASMPGQKQGLMPSLTPGAGVGPGTVAEVNGESISRAEWQKVVSIDLAMSQLAGQPSPDTEFMLDRLVNRKLVMQAAGQAGIVVDDSQAGERLASLWQGWNTGQVTVEHVLASAGLSRQDLLDELKQLLVVEKYLERLSATADPDEWLAAQRSRAQVSVYAELPAVSRVAPALASPTPEPSPAATPSPTPEISTGVAAGQRAPDFSLQRDSGEKVSLNDYVDKSNVVLVFYRGQT